MLRRLAMIAGPLVLLIATAVVLYLTSPAPKAAEVVEHLPADGMIRLTPAKLAGVKLETAVAQQRELHRFRMVPARVTYNEQRWVRLNSPVEAVIQRVLVKPGDDVHPGTPLAVLRSAAVAQARSDVERKRADVRLAEQTEQWESQIAQTLQELTASLRKRPDPKQAEQDYESRTLGTHRVQVLGAYARLIEAEYLVKDLETRVADGSLTAKIAREREANREVAQAEFSGACEQAEFNARQTRLRARADLEQAQRTLAVAEQHLRTLLGAHSEVVTGSLGTPEGNTPLPVANIPEDLSLFSIVSPIQGTLEFRHAASTQRVNTADPLFEVANIERLWISADLRERDWQGLDLRPGLGLRVELPALDNHVTTAHVDHVGRRVDGDTHAVPLIAVIDNQAGKLKPGMFAWVWIPSGPSQTCLSVPASSIVTHERQQFVFLQPEPGVFKAIKVTTDVETPEWVGISAGLTAGDRVVSHGTFVLKSELLLEPEDE